ncbi:GNAT family N-acetyltransferase [Mucilaginibacter sp. RS28]|uniref:GNAT family N-acetyltransferase n=1 Tax=Mucilaginibacter straminoryzae TaxID=2932774 RepID=A0A9X1X1Q4_9SPHI|nr:GNAT family N-acetyltransferase [Mucilaginibacter straminoryzae]MCJ8209408.1 GNAT family N-acetyltransferase [Mucilaginibacter straminoryzae]
MAENIEITIATIADLADLEVIFSLYRSFYGMPHDKEAAIDFLKERIQQQESIIFLARKNSAIVGFTQLFPTFSSASLKKVFILNDLYVLEEERNQGIARLLINRSIEEAKYAGCVRISLSTAKDNPAQLLYEKIGFKESGFKFYNYTI